MLFKTNINNYNTILNANAIVNFVINQGRDFTAFLCDSKKKRNKRN